MSSGASARNGTGFRAHLNGTIHFARLSFFLDKSFFLCQAFLCFFFVVQAIPITLKVCSTEFVLS